MSCRVHWVEPDTNQRWWSIPNRAGLQRKQSQLRELLQERDAVVDLTAILKKKKKAFSLYSTAKRIMLRGETWCTTWAGEQKRRRGWSGTKGVFECGRWQIEPCYPLPVDKFRNTFKPKKKKKLKWRRSFLWEVCAPGLFICTSPDVCSCWDLLCLKEQTDMEQEIAFKDLEWCLI